MENLDPQLARELTNHVKNNILAEVPEQIDQLNSDSIDNFRNKLHILQYYCTQRELDSDIVNRLNNLLETSRKFWELMEDNASTLADLGDTYKMRWLSLTSALLSELEEIVSGEESFRDIVVNSIAIMLGWKSDTVWVDMAKEDHRLLSKSHLVKLRDELWQFIGESSATGSEMTLKKATEIGEKMNLLLQFVAADDLPVVARIMLLSQVYILLLKLNIGKILVILDTNFKETEEK